MEIVFRIKEPGGVTFTQETSWTLTEARQFLTQLLDDGNPHRNVNPTNEYARRLAGIIDKLTRTYNTDAQLPPPLYPVLTVTFNGEGLLVSWPEAPGVESVKIYGAKTANVGTASPSQTIDAGNEFLFLSGKPGETYYFRGVAYNSEGDASDLSPIVSATFPELPEQPVVSVARNGQVNTISWEAVGEYEPTYKVFWLDSPGINPANGAGTVIYEGSGLEATHTIGVDSYYAVVAEMVFGRYPMSAEVHQAV